MLNNIFGDKKNEIDQFLYYIDKIVSGTNSKWKITPETYSVTIHNKINRTFSKDELESFEKQAEYLISNLPMEKIIQKNIIKIFKFRQMLINIKSKHRMLNKPFCIVHDPVILIDQKHLYSGEEKMTLDKNKDSENHVFFTGKFNFTLKDYHSIGQCILNGSDNKKPKILVALFKVIANEDFNHHVINGFKRKILFKMKSFNPIEIGRELTKYIYSNRLIIDHSLDTFKGISLLSSESFQKLFNFLEKRKRGISLLIANVPKPAHTYHLIQASHVIMNSNRNHISKYYCNLDNIIFCTKKQNFRESINHVSNSSNESTYYIIHPENLSYEEISYFKSFISAQRFKSNIENRNAFKLPTIIIITALPPSFFDLNQSNVELFEDYESFNENDVSNFATFNSKWRSFTGTNKEIFLFSSKQPGIDKTFLINRIIKKTSKIEIRKSENDVYTKDINSGHFTIDASTQEIPSTIFFFWTNSFPDFLFFKI